MLHSGTTQVNITKLNFNQDVSPTNQIKPDKTKLYGSVCVCVCVCVTGVYISAKDITWPSELNQASPDN